MPTGTRQPGLDEENHMRIANRTRSVAVLVTLAGVLTVASCGSDDDSSADEPTAETDETADAPADTSADEPADSTEPAEETAETSTEEPTDEPDIEPVTITYLASQNWVLDSERELAEQFEAETGITVDYQIIPADQYFSVLQTKLEAGGEGIDIFGGQSGKTDIQLQLDVEKNAVPLTDEEWVQRMDPLSTEQVSLDGTVYGLTIWDTVGGSWVIVYNTSIFEEHGIEVPSTYDELAAACSTLSDAGVTPIYEPVSDGWHHVLWFAELGPVYEQNSPGLYDALNDNEVNMASDTTMQTSLTQLNELYSNDCFGDNALSDEFANTEASMASGDFAMTVNRLGLPAQIEAADPTASADDYGFFLMPLADNQIWNVNPAAPTKFIYSGSEHVDAAKAYFEFLARPENLQFVLDNEAQFALLNFEGATAELTEAQQAFVDAYPDQGTVLQTAVNYVNPQWIEMGQDIVAMFTGAETPTEVLEAIDGRRAEMATAADDPAWG
jgi:raffinose/stachyose/melibiose transport system substrate-binding protein